MISMKDNYNLFSTDKNQLNHLKNVVKYKQARVDHCKTKSFNQHEMDKLMVSVAKYHLMCFRKDVAKRYGIELRQVED